MQSEGSWQMSGMKRLIEMSMTEISKPMSNGAKEFYKELRELPDGEIYDRLVAMTYRMVELFGGEATSLLLGVMAAEVKSI